MSNEYSWLEIGRFYTGQIYRFQIEFTLGRNRKPIPCVHPS